MIIELEPISAIVSGISGAVALIKGKLKGNGNDKSCPVPCASVQTILNEGTKRMDELVRVAHQTNKLTMAIAYKMELIDGSIKDEVQDLMK